MCVSQERTVVCLYVCVQCLARLSHLSHDALSLVSAHRRSQAVVCRERRMRDWFGWSSGLWKRPCGVQSSRFRLNYGSVHLLLVKIVPLGFVKRDTSLLCVWVCGGGERRECVHVCGLWGHTFVYWHGYYKEKEICEDIFSVPIIQKSYKSYSVSFLRK